MSTSFPVDLDTLTNPLATDETTSPSHAGQHSNSNDAIEALESNVGIDSSLVNTSHDYKLSGVADGDKAVSLTGSETLTNKTFTSPTINLATITTPTVTNGNFTTPTLTQAVVATSLDMNASELILDANADTTITADTEDTIDIKINGADDFQFTTNTFKALSGSTIATNTIAETTADNGVAIDGFTIKDSGLPKIILNVGGELTISSGAITVTGTYHTVDTEGDASTDDLQVINGGTAGQILVLRTAANVRDVVVKDVVGGSDNIYCGSDITLSSIQDTVTLLCLGTTWVRMAVGDNN
jgi:hypothetical protein